MLALNFTRLLINKQYRGRPRDKPIKPISYDTETINGRCELITCSDGNYLHPNCIEDCLQFLTRKSTYGFTGFFYNLKYDWQAVLKHVDPDLWIELHEKNEIEIGKFKIVYIPAKFLKIKKRNRRVWVFYDLAQFYITTLENASKKYLGEGKKDVSKYDMANLTYDDMHDPEFIGYGLKDARLCNRLAILFIDACHDMGLVGGNFSSRASLAYSYFSRKCKIPTINQFLDKDSTYELLRYPWNATSGAFISVFKRGYFPDAHVYDINSSYPARMAALPDYTYGDFYVDEGRPDDDCYHGWMHVVITIDPTDQGSYHPCIPILRKNASNYYPIGRMDTWITLAEYRVFSKYYDIEVIDGLYWVPNKLVYPFREEINKCYQARKVTKEYMYNQFYKYVLNGLYGKTLQKIQIKDPDDPNYLQWRAGPMFSPMWASYILAESRLAVFKLLLNCPKASIIACFTDSVITDRALSINTSRELGGWDFDKRGECVMIGCGVYTIISNGVHKTKLRGFRSKNIDLIEHIERYKTQAEISIDHVKNISPITALREHRINDMNLLLNEPKKVNINFDAKRLWHRGWQCAGDILDKPPIESSPYIME